MTCLWPKRLTAAAYALAALAFINGVAVTPVLAAQAVTERPTKALSGVAVGPQYDTTHIYLASADFDAFVASFIATFGGAASHRAVFTVTPTPSKTASQYIQTPAGMVSVFAFETPIPYPFGREHVGYLVTDLDQAIHAARAAGADVLVESFDDPIGKDAIIQWPGGWTMQLYWHTKAPSYAPLETLPETRVYVSAQSADKFIRSFKTFSHGHVALDDHHADGAMIGRPDTVFRLVRLASPFGKMAVFVTDGKLPYPYGLESTGYAVNNLDATLTKAQASGAKVISTPYADATQHSVMVQFPGGYIAEIHDAAK